MRDGDRFFIRRIVLYSRYNMQRSRAIPYICPGMDSKRLNMHIASDDQVHGPEDAQRLRPFREAPVITASTTDPGKIFYESRVLRFYQKLILLSPRLNCIG